MCLATFEIIPVGRMELVQAEMMAESDLDDNVSLTCAQVAGLDVIVTRDPRGLCRFDDSGPVPPPNCWPCFRRTILSNSDTTFVTPTGPRNSPDADWPFRQNSPVAHADSASRTPPVVPPLPRPNSDSGSPCRPRPLSRQNAQPDGFFGDADPREFVPRRARRQG